MVDKKYMKDIGLNDPVTVTLPAHTWLSFIVSYVECDWTSAAASVVAEKIQEELLDPVWKKEREAAAHEQLEKQKEQMEKMLGNLTGYSPEGDDLT